MVSHRSAGLADQLSPEINRPLQNNGTRRPGFDCFVSRRVNALVPILAPKQNPTLLELDFLYFL